MPRRKINKTSIITKTTEAQMSPPPLHEYPRRYSWVKNGIIILLLLLAVIAFKYKNLFIVATVDGKPITRWQLEKELNSKYGSQVLDNIVSEQIILSEAQKRGATVDDAAVNTKIKDIENQLKGKMSLDDALKAQGLTQDSFRKQLAIQLAIDKMFDKEATVSDKEIDDFIAQNKESLTESTDPAKLRADVYTNLRQQKIGGLFDKWFTAAKSKVNIVKF